MTEWPSFLNVNMRAYYLAYAFRLRHRQGLRDSDGNLAAWAEAGLRDLSNSDGFAQFLYAAIAGQLESPPSSPEEQVLGPNQGSEVAYPTGDIVVPFDPRAEESPRARSDSPSETESFISPDSRSSVSQGVHFPQADLSTCETNAIVNETSSGAPEASCSAVPASSSPTEVLRNAMIVGNVDPSETVLEPSTTSKKPKPRPLFTELQLNTLLQRFSVQRYLSPAEMKDLAELTGLTYKQVKTWFQNRRMKLRRMTKDNSWGAGRLATNKEQGGCRPFFNIPQQSTSYQEEARPYFMEQFNQPMTGMALQQTTPQTMALQQTTPQTMALQQTNPQTMALQQTTPQNMALQQTTPQNMALQQTTPQNMALQQTTPQNMPSYLHPMEPATGSSGYPPWMPDQAQAALTSRPEAAGWSMPTGTNHYDYNPFAFSSANIASADNTGVGASSEVDAWESVYR